MFFRKKDRKIANQKAMITNRDILIGDIVKQKEILKEENNYLKYKNKEQKNLIDKLYKLSTSNKYENEKDNFKQNKRTNPRPQIKELVQNENLDKFISDYIIADMGKESQMGEKEVLEIDIENLKDAYERIQQALNDLIDVDGLDEQFNELHNIAEDINDERIRKENELEMLEEIA